MTALSLNANWLGISTLTIERKRTILWATVSFVVYLTFVIMGTEVQRLLPVKLEMNWGQHILGLLAVLLIAAFHKNPRELLAFTKPQTSNWLQLTSVWSLITIALGLLADIIIDNPAKLNSVEYYLFQSFMPSISEELGLRGLFLGFLLYYAKRRNLSQSKIWLIILIHAISFGLLHLLEAQSVLESIVLFSFTGFAAVVLAWLRLRTASIIPCIVAHSLMNVLGNLVGYTFFELIR